MSIRMQRAARIAAGATTLAATVAGLQALGRHIMRRPLPQCDGTVMIAGLRKPVEIIRDRWGVPHIYAATGDDLFFAQGYVHAQDRLFQMDTGRRVGSGRLSEVIGSYGLASDRAARVFGWHRAAEAQVAGILAEGETAAVAEAYAAGVNAFISEGRLPLEFRLLRYTPEQWRPYDSAAWGAVLAWGLSVNWETELLRAKLIQTLGAHRAADFTPVIREDYLTILSGGAGGARLAEALLQAYQESANVLSGGTRLPGGVGSNNWVVSGEHTTSGRAILANDPHLPPLFPTIWYENHLIGGDFHVTGFTSPGVPGVLIGHNEHIAWGITNAFPDIQDLYVERFHADDPLLYEVNGSWRPAEERVERIDVRWRRQPHLERVRYTRHGPVISDLVPDGEHDLALRWMCHERNNHMMAVLKTCRATDWASFREALRDWAFPSQNVVYADTDGNVGYVMPGRVPIRSRGHGLVPVPGWTDEYEWQGWIPPLELPARFNPRDGMIVTANNQVAGSDYPYWLSGEWLPPYRAQRIADLLRAGSPLDVAAMERIQQDTVSLPMQRFIALSLPSLEPTAELPPELRAAAIRLRAWDGDMNAGSVAASIAFAWLVHFLEAVLDQALGPEHAATLPRRHELEYSAASPFHELSYELALRWLAGEAPEWIGPVTPLLQPALARALAALAQHLGPAQADWAWGRLHMVHIESQLSRMPILGGLWRARTLPLGGDGFTVNQADIVPAFPPKPVHVIASCRLVVDVGAWDNSRSALPGGQSGHPASEHYQDHIDDWYEGRYHPMVFSRDAVERVGTNHLTLLPLTGGSVEE